MTEKHIPDEMLAQLRERESADREDRKRRTWQALKTVAGWIAACLIVAAVGYDTLLRAIGRK